MSTLAPESITAPASSVTRPTAAHLLNAPLPELLAEFGVQLDTSSITDPTFTGYMVVERGRVVISLPPDRSAPEREIACRVMLGRALRVPLPPLPAPFKVTQL